MDLAQGGQSTDEEPCAATSRAALVPVAPTDRHLVGREELLAFFLNGEGHLMIPLTLVSSLIMTTNIQRAGGQRENEIQEWPCAWSG